MKLWFVVEVYSLVDISLQTLRVQSSEGTKRIDVVPSDTTVALFEKVSLIVVQYNNLKYFSIYTGCYKKVLARPIRFQIL